MIETTIPVAQKLFRGDRSVRIAMVGLPGSGKSTIFNAVASTAVQTGSLNDADEPYGQCRLQVGLDEADLIDLPSIRSLLHQHREEHDTLHYLLWGNELPPVAIQNKPTVPYSPPDVIIQVIDATALDRNLELTLELSQLGRPVVIALNMSDQAEQKGLHINSQRLSELLGMPVVSTVATMGQGIAKLFDTAVKAVREDLCPLPQPASKHICESLKPLSQALNRPEIHQAFRVPLPLLSMQVASGDSFFIAALTKFFPGEIEKIQRLCEQASAGLPRRLDEEIHADRHHRAATLFESVSHLGVTTNRHDWRYWADEFFLHPRFGLIGSLFVFAVILFVVFEVSAWLDSATIAHLISWVEQWHPTSTSGVIGRAVVDGLVGMAGIVIPYMIPLVMLLVMLEESGIMHRIAFVVDRWFHYLGLHGGVAVPFLLGLGCNVPALSAVATATSGRERIIASILITFVPCSARTAVILALAGKYLGGLGIFAIFVVALVVIAVMGQIFRRHYRQAHGPGQIQEIPDYAMPQLKTLLYTTWNRTSDILTIVTPLLVAGSVILALLGHFGADDAINSLFTPITNWWLGLPVVLGVPILFGILRKELSLLMIYQAIGSFDVGSYMDWIQLSVFLIFLTFYFPCVSTFAVMLKTIGVRSAMISVSISVTVALIIGGLVRLVLESSQYLIGS